MLKKFFSDFKEFAMKGNVIDMALGVVIGSAFGKIVSSFVADVITPFISLITGNVNLTDLKAVLRPAELSEAGEVVRAEVALTYGNFLLCVIDFFVIALSLFLFLRIMMNIKKKMEEASAKLLKKKQEEEAEEEKEEEPSEDIKLLTEIRDLLKKEEEEK